MPQASDELRARMIARFGSTDPFGPTNFLTEAGYRLQRFTYQWKMKPNATPEYSNMTRDEFDCLMFLVHEWDYGGLVDVELKKIEARL